MAFFNLTALGPRSVYKSLLKNRSLLHIFDEEDIQQAFDQIQLEGKVSKQKIPEFLSKLYHGTYPECDATTLLKSLRGVEDPTLKQLLQAFHHAKRTLEAEEETNISTQRTCPGVNFISYKEYREATQRHKRKKESSVDIMLTPLTSNDEYGWHAATAHPTKVFAKKSCPETLYAAELVKAGIYY